MTLIDLIRVIGLSHLLQPPLTIFLSTPSGVDLRASLIPKTPLAREVLYNMAFASVCLPTALGLVIALYPAEVMRSGGLRAVALTLAAFWSWRLYRQLKVLSAFWSSPGRAGAMLNRLLTVIFAVQGPGLGWLLFH